MFKYSSHDSIFTNMNFKTNIFFQIDGVLVTPDLSLAGVAGAMRDKIIETCGRHGPGCEIGLVSPDDVRHAGE